jgi:sigma-70-like protein
LRHEQISLAFLGALQHLTPAQRAVLLLREVLEWKASEVAEWLDLSVPTVNSALQRARHTLHQRSKENGSETPVAQPRPQLQNLLDRYMTLWQQADVPGLVALLREDAWLTMPPLPAWFRDERILLLCSGSGSSLPANNGGCCQRAPMAARLSGSIGGKVGKTADSHLPCGSWGWKANRSAASLCSWM